MNKKYTNTNECVNISKNHAIFNFTIWENFDTTLVKGNVIVNRKLEQNATACVMVKDASVPDDVLQDAINGCVNRAKFIFEE